MKHYTLKDLKAVNDFIQNVERRAEEKMLKTGKLEGAHYAAMKEIQAEMQTLQGEARLETLKELQAEGQKLEQPTPETGDAKRGWSR